MKIFFRYILFRLLLPFLFILVACISSLAIVDLMGSLNEFTDNANATTGLMVQFYVSYLPSFLVQVMPVSLLFASLYALMSLRRTHELTAMQAGGISPTSIYIPFFIVAILSATACFYLISGPATEAQRTRADILATLRGKATDKSVIKGVPYVDYRNRQTWYLGRLDTVRNTAENIELLMRDETGEDKRKIFARRGEFTGIHWTFYDVRDMTFAESGVLAEQTNHERLILDDVVTPPVALAFVQLQPEEMTYNELQDLVTNTTRSIQGGVAPYVTQKHYFFAYSTSHIVLVIFALAFASGHGRQSVAAGVFNSIFVLLAFLFFMEFFKALGRTERLPPAVGAWAAQAIFGLIAIVLLMSKTGVFWHLNRWWRRRLGYTEEVLPDRMPTAVMNLRLGGLKLLLQRVTDRAAEIGRASFQGLSPKKKKSHAHPGTGLEPGPQIDAPESSGIEYGAWPEPEVSDAEREAREESLMEPPSQAEGEGDIAKAGPIEPEVASAEYADDEETRVNDAEEPDLEDAASYFPEGQPDIDAPDEPTSVIYEPDAPHYHENEPVEADEPEVSHDQNYGEDDDDEIVGAGISGEVVFTGPSVANEPETTSQAAPVHEPQPEPMLPSTAPEEEDDPAAEARRLLDKLRNDALSFGSPRDSASISPDGPDAERK